MTIFNGGPGPESVDGSDANDMLRGGGGVAGDHFDDLADPVADETMAADSSHFRRRVDGPPASPERFDGTEGDDSFVGGSSADVLIGRGGRDTLLGGGGNDFVSVGSDDVGPDILDGGDGFDHLEFYRRFATFDIVIDVTDPDLEHVLPDGTVIRGFEELRVQTGGGDDRIVGGHGRELIISGDGDDTAAGGDGADTLYGEAGDDVLDGGAGEDYMIGGTGDDTIYGGATDFANAESGVDLLVWSTAPGAAGVAMDIVGSKIVFADGTYLANFERIAFSGADGDDTVSGGAYDDTLVGGGGDDSLSGGGGGVDLLDGGDGDDYARIASAQNGTLLGGDGDDELISGSGAATIEGGAGADTIDGGGGADVILVGRQDGVDRIDGGSGGGADLLSLDRGGSSLGVVLSIAQPGVLQTLADGTEIVRIEQISVVGSDGDDSITGGALSDTMVGGGGDDTLTGGAGGGDLLIDDRGADSLVGSSGHDTVSGGRGKDTISGLEGDDLVDAGAGSDRVLGGEGDDTLRGLAGADILEGGAGADTLAGGAEADRFLFTSLDDSPLPPDERDLITDFSGAAGEGDRIVLTRIDAVAATAANDAFAFIGAESFHGVAGELRAELVGPAGYIVSGDVDGDGAADFAIRVKSEAALQAADFLL